MAPTMLAFLEGLGVAIGLIAAMFFLWVRPTLQRERETQLALKAQLEREASHLAEAARLEAKEEALKYREHLEEEFRARELTALKLEEKLSLRDDGNELRRLQIEDREAELRALRLDLESSSAEVQSQREQVELKLQAIAGLTREEACEALLARVESEVTELAQARAKEIEEKAISEADRRAKQTILDTIQRTAVDYVTEATLAVVELPSEDMKGRIIGREGRNIRAFEQVTGVDLIIDETPEAVVISCFDPVRRETARLTLMNLMLDGRIHPGRIEELHEKANLEVDRMIREAGERAVERANVSGIGPRIVEMMGRLRFRTSYAQNVLDHSVETSRIAGTLAAELGFNIEVAKRAGLLHDIGKALGSEWEGPHAITGMEYLRSLGEKEAITHAVGAHHFDIDPTTPEAQIVIVADSLSAARPGARRENLENYLKRLTALEALATAFPGVERAYAVQAGRELRLLVKPCEIDDLGATRLANEVAQKIETDLEYPGQIKVTVIRETRVSQVAK